MQFKPKNQCVRRILENKQIRESVLNVSKYEFYKISKAKMREMERLFYPEEIEGFLENIERVRCIMIKRAERKLKD